MFGRKTKKRRSGPRNRTILCYNYYTSFDLAYKLEETTDHEIKTFGTMRMNYIDAHIKVNDKRATAILESAERNSFFVVQAFIPVRQENIRRLGVRNVQSEIDQYVPLLNSGYVT